MKNPNGPVPALFKAVVTVTVMLGLIFPALAADRTELDYRLRKLAIKFESMQAKPDKRIPAENLRKARGIVLMDRTKAGFIFGYQGGGGIALVKDPETGRWSAPAFFTAAEASLGFQVGGQQSFVVVLLMNTNATESLTRPTVKFGGEASGTAGNDSAGVESVVSSEEPLVLVYTDTAGLYGGAAIKGDTLSPDTDANREYYGDFLTTGEILFGKRARPTDTTADLAKRLDEASK
jgi:lipid-binding SYLF domain-containing protein